MQELQEWKEPDGTPRICACYKLYGCPVWIPVDAADGYDAQLVRIKNLLEQANKVFDQLQAIKELAKQIYDAKF